MRILFVCTGNTCRSPMAEALCRSILREEKRTDISCGSAGIFGENGSPASENAAAACHEIGVDLSAHRARSLTKKDLEETDVFFVMTPRHAQALLSCGVPQEKIYLPQPPVPDPYMGNLAVYRACRDALEAAVRTFLKERCHD